MGKKRNVQPPPIMPGRVKVEIKDEIGDSDVLVARDRLKGALRELLQHSDTGSSADSSEESPSHDYKQQMKKTTKAMNFQQPRKIRRRRQVPTDTPFHHTYVMKLFDRSVDLAQFQEDTPLYPICRAWMANQPRNPNLVPKVRSPSPEIVNEVNMGNNIFDTNGELSDVHYLPPPLPCEEAIPKNRIPSPIVGEKDELNLDYDGHTLKSRETLMKEHTARWNAIRKKWHQQAHKNELRFIESANILSTIFKKAQSEFE
ncbi:PREDICTED: protein lin-37 homolog [Dinoponera quadriceps]|uniref:Protein lin-37 homolog n=1 Tax=Dinoponera quadriceps TaxID=609295 RepID=A0A6P3XJM7_DINQU|nr:PREDICTED: protein lin-37 homolog [Dinoponera quadriceps]XP_014478183.1 PREDICTED: protein lin-37 homolog [Dinoponera quadriceps]XP_014478184.1 PREDICTED: protein lin-37 homolog [Dinoponera quadriceps]XP_014478186.1 PREDICTED: protein lin-37 homolog [Dinoponera quadriceps]XP_014478187.1 PREDICTED: protein lin-37 homolog [Dinoponera quadriceps]XP_014478188.1 PREDICTED: protein lin-37 homolog [Dinoponera quadriceps]XP_014478189.1 PREDICTED: protein lin-37 homolog [Dinoponera quadriceps]